MNGILPQQIITLRNSGANLISLLVRNTVTTGTSRVVYNSKEAASNKPQLRVVTSAQRIADAEAEDLDTFTQQLLHKIKIYPQPASDYINVELPEEYSRSVLRILDLNGRQVAEFGLSEGIMHLIPVNFLISGMYLLIAENQNATIRKKLIIEK